MKGSQGKQVVSLVSLLALCLLVPCSQAVMFVSTSDPAHNTNAPTGSLTNAGWQYEWKWNNWIGTPIAPTFFLAAQHINGAIGQVIIFNNYTNHTVNFFDDPNSDLRIWQVAETFPSYAPLYTGTSEAGSLCFIVGRGTDRGPTLVVGGVTKGWLWGNTNNIERWGQNTVSGVTSNAMVGQLLYAIVNLTGGVTDECVLSYNDSSGGWFIKDSGIWKLAGITYAVSQFNVSTNGVDGSGMNVAMADYFGIYLGGDGHWMIDTNHDVGFFVSTRVSAHIDWINSIINSQLGLDLGIVGIQTVSPDVEVSVTTGSNRLYRVDRTSSLTNSVWATVTNNVQGTGGIVTVIDPGAAVLSNRYYRATMLPPP